MQEILTTRQIFGRGNVQTHEIFNVLGNVTTCDIYGIQVYSRFDIVNSTVTFPVHFHTDFWSRNVTFFPVIIITSHTYYTAMSGPWCYYLLN